MFPSASIAGNVAPAVLPFPKFGDRFFPSVVVRENPLAPDSPQYTVPVASTANPAFAPPFGDLVRHICVPFETFTLCTDPNVPLLPMMIFPSGHFTGDR